jgi:triosephosphate isomerase (TIM)
LPEESTAVNTVIAYEPVWAIGTGLRPREEEIAATLGVMRSFFARRSAGEGTPGWRILYGGSVTPENAEDLLTIPETGGVLVGGASLNAPSFLAIISAATKAFTADSASPV